MLSRIFFIFFVMLVFWWLNAFFLFHFYRLFSFVINRTYIYFIIGLTFILPFSMFLHQGLPNIFTRWFYIISLTWLGIIFIGFYISIFFDCSVNLLKIPLIYKAYTWSILIVWISVFALYNQSWVPWIKNIAIKNSKLSQDIKIWYLSDIHIDWLHNISYLDKIIDKLNNENIDVVLINWDFVDGTSFEKHSFKTLDRLKVPVYITFWNHESYIWKDFAKSLFIETKAKVLENEIIDYKWLQILWIEDMMGMNHSYNENKLENILKNMNWDKSRASLMLLHEPLGSEIADRYWIDIQLAGHTHNWQIWPFNYLVQTIFPRILWMYKIGNLTLYVWPWSGVWWPPMRLWSKNEITIISLEKE